MAEHYCPFCGDHHGGETPAEAAADEVIETAAEVTSAEVRIAEINADRDVKLARINAGMMDHDRDVEAARTEGKVEALEEVIAPEPQPDPAPIIIDAPEAIADDAPEDALPEAGETEGSTPPAATKKKLGLGAW